MIRSVLFEACTCVLCMLCMYACMNQGAAGTYMHSSMHTCIYMCVSIHDVHAHAMHMCLCA
jgi:hypothetical protein